MYLNSFVFPSIHIDRAVLCSLKDWSLHCLTERLDGTFDISVLQEQGLLCRLTYYT